jgi:hypothetical protein
MKYTTVLDGPHPMNIHTITNQKQVTTTEGSMEGRCDERDTWGKCDTIIMRAL